MDTLLDKVLLLGAAQGAVLAAVLAARRKNRVANRILAALVAALALMLLTNLVDSRAGDHCRFILIGERFIRSSSAHRDGQPRSPVGDILG